ncbi:hypothetical protein ACG33_05385 [Steroidobacter denitrificans]|uniref:L,D-TPase catalytic domain-containing protein n=1 Tax=Steroidobacter denitrificans TaxID=465721 RepID=A0A127FAB1_STEDE|nr:hypothetical protein ACG33_05385 [Steroidobacter denitrificans]
MELSGLDETRGSQARIAWAAWIRDFYAQRAFQPAWTNPHTSFELLRSIQESELDGLDPGDYHLAPLQHLQAALSSSGAADPARIDLLRAQYDVLQTDALLRLGYHLSFGKVDPESFDAQWNYGRMLPRPDTARRIEAALAADDIHARIEALKPTHRLYAALKAELRRYRLLAAADVSGMSSAALLSAGKTLRPGDVDPRVLQLRERLRIHGDLDAGLNADARPDETFRARERQDETADEASDDALAGAAYDARLEAAVRRFQARMGLVVDAAVGTRTREELNVSVAERILQLRINLDRGRILLQELPSQFVVVNIAGYMIYMVRDDEVIWRSRVQVGRTYRRTPIFRSAISYLVWNPSWTVPPGIIRSDILPGARRDPRSITRRGLTVLDREGKVIDPETIDWSSFRSGHIPYTLRQEPGPDNAMGRVKFMFPNNYDVYLHDTPSKSLFEASDRTFSSGCVRVERPLELALLLLNDPEWNAEAIAHTLESRRLLNVTLRDKMPVLLTYWTAWAGAQGEINFRRDVYGQDAQWAAGLDAPFNIRRRPLVETSRP